MSDTASARATALGAPTDISPVFLEPDAIGEPAAQPSAQASAEPSVEPAPLLELRDGVPRVVDDDAALRQAVDRLGAGTGPVAVDAERASSYRYGHRAYLVQLRREGAGIVLIDPINCPDLSALTEALGDAEWIVHAANQDLPCLADLGMYPPTLFDTELAGRLAGFPRVGLATMVEQLLGWRMEKDHSAADWSSRPLPEPWLRYAALDVELLIELRDALEAELQRQDKLEWAHQEFEHVRTVPVAAVSLERWRRVSGIHKIHHRRQLAIVRSLWLTRDRIASETDVSPSRVLPDSSIVVAATSTLASARELSAAVDFHGRGSRRYLTQWWEAIAEATALPDADLPESTRPSLGPPPAHRWAERDRAAADRLAAAKAVVAALADEHGLPAENLLQPDAVRRLAWRPPSDLAAGPVGDDLRSFAAREWQIALTAGPIARALLRAATQDESTPSAAPA